MCIRDSLHPSLFVEQQLPSALMFRDNFIKQNNFKENEELDIIVLTEKIKLMMLSLLLQIFRRSKSFLLGWKKLLVVIIAGLLLGYFLTDSKLPNAKEATVLVKINFDA